MSSVGIDVQLCQIQTPRKRVIANLSQPESFEPEHTAFLELYSIKVTIEKKRCSSGCSEAVAMSPTRQSVCTSTSSDSSPRFHII